MCVCDHVSTLLMAWWWHPPPPPVLRAGRTPPPYASWDGTPLPHPSCWGHPSLPWWRPSPCASFIGLRALHAHLSPFRFLIADARRKWCSTTFVSNVLLTSCADNVCRIWTETAHHESLGFYVAGVIDPAEYSALAPFAQTPFILNWVNTHVRRPPVMDVHFCPYPPHKAHMTP